MKGTGKYGAVARITLLSSMAYWGDMAFRSLFMVVVLFVFVQLWTVTYEEGGFQDIAGFSLRDVIWYLVLTEAAILSAPRISARIAQEVKSGELVNVLVRPYNYLAYQLACYWGEAAVLLPVNLALGFAVVLLLAGPPDTTPFGVATAGLALVLSLTLNFLVEMAIGLAAFWVEETQPFFWIYQKLVFTLGGLFMPLELFPEGLGMVAAVLPFAAITYAPGRLFVGDPSLSLPACLLASQALWMAFLVGLAVLVYGRAVRKVSVHGG